MMAPSRAKIASPPIQVWMPNQPQAMTARSRAARLAPRSPNGARANTGNGMPYFVPAWLLSSIGMSTMMFPSAMRMMACTQLNPTAMRPEASR